MRTAWCFQEIKSIVGNTHTHRHKYPTDLIPQREVTQIEEIKGSRTFHFNFALGWTCCWTNILRLLLGASQRAQQITFVGLYLSFCHTKSAPRSEMMDCTLTEKTQTESTIKLRLTRIYKVSKRDTLRKKYVQCIFLILHLRGAENRTLLSESASLHQWCCYSEHNVTGCLGTPKVYK